MSEYISAALRRSVAERAQHYCECCGVPDTATFIPHEPDHVIAFQHGGTMTLENLAYACFECNRFKGPNLASRDLMTGAVTPLYHPREQRWTDHFNWQDATIEPLTATGRATVFLLRLNLEDRMRFRANWLSQGVAPGPA
jgi:HNH endonuclease